MHPKSIWSINDTLFTLSSLTVVVPIVALSTYTIVLNLDNIANFFRPICTYASTSMSSLFRHFIDSQIRGMQHDHTSIWKKRGTAFKKSRVMREGDSRPSQWRILQFALRQVVLNLWCAFTSLNVLVPQALGGLRRGRPADHFLGAPLGHLGDVRVQVQVDVNVETTQAAPESETSLR